MNTTAPCAARYQDVPVYHSTNQVVTNYLPENTTSVAPAGVPARAPLHPGDPTRVGCAAFAGL